CPACSVNSRSSRATWPAAKRGRPTNALSKRKPRSILASPSAAECYLGDFTETFRSCAGRSIDCRTAVHNQEILPEGGIVNFPKLVAVVVTSFAASLATAGTINVPAKRPVITVNIPDSWEPEETEKGTACESPDKVVTVFFEIARGAKSR